MFYLSASGALPGVPDSWSIESGRTIQHDELLKTIGGSPTDFSKNRAGNTAILKRKIPK